MKLTAENYYSTQANRKWMSVSQFKAFLSCEAAALAELRGQWRRPESTALLVGSYVDAKLEGESAFQEFKAAHPEIFKKDGSPKAEFVQAEKIYQKITGDRLMCLLLSGRKQVIVKGKIAGVPFRGKIDSLLDIETCQIIMREFPDTRDVLGGLFCTGAIVDGKVMRDFSPVFSEREGRRVSWISAWDYQIQGAVYQFLEGSHKPFILAAASKESEPDLTAEYVPQNELDAALQTVVELAPRYHEIKQGRIMPTRCESCAYCRATKKLTVIKNYKEA